MVTFNPVNSKFIKSYEHFFKFFKNQVHCTEIETKSTVYVVTSTKKIKKYYTSIHTYYHI